MFQRFVFIIALISLIVNVFLGYSLFKKEPTLSDQQELYPYLSKRIFTEKQNDILINFIPLREAMRNYVSKQPEQIGIYFEYLPSGNSVGVNDQIEVRLASLIKIPIVMAIYKQIELGKTQKEELLTITESDINKEFGDLWKKGVGTQLTVKEAVDLSLIKSDNTASRVLASSLPEYAIDDVFDSLDIPKDIKEELPVISPKNYSSILRSLYLSSYLSKEDSSEILELLTVTDFKDMIPAGVDPSIKVAHKIGVFESDEVYSDCGIIYVPNRPYTLCIMVRSNKEKARTHMVLLSKMIYGYIAAVKGR